ncbi:MAG: nucleotidyltransferase domain-containing protein [Bacteroidota bacterium]
MTSINENKLEIIKNTCRELFPACRILLFGSRAREDHSERSDYDFLVITKNTLDIQRKRFYKSLLRKRLAKFKIPADVLIQSESEIVVKEKIPGHIVRQILKEGVAI